MQPVNLLLFLIVHTGRMELAVECTEDAKHYGAALKAFRQCPDPIQEESGFDCPLLECFAAERPAGIWRRVVVGTVGFRERDAEMAELKRMYVAQAHRAQGIGLALLRQAVRIRSFNQRRPRPRVFPVIADLFETVPAFTAALRQHLMTQTDAGEPVVSSAGVPCPWVSYFVEAEKVLAYQVW